MMCSSGAAFHASPSCVIYNPGTGTWTTTTSLKNARVNHISILLPHGQVPDAAGENANNELISAELFIQ
jgi:large repetitive protein